MNHSRRVSHRLVAAVCAIIVLGAAGCNQALWLDRGLSTALGWFVGRITAPTDIDTICFRNGVQVDCSTINALDE